MPTCPPTARIGGGAFLFRADQSWLKCSAALLTLCFGGCSIMPSSGPQAMDVRTSEENAAPQSLPYALVKLTPEVVHLLGRVNPRLSSAFADKTPPKTFRFGIGDT